MNKSVQEENYEIYNASIEEREEIELFFRTNWKKSQILEEIPFNYFYGEASGTTFVIARNRENRQIAGVSGYIKCSDQAAFGSCFLVKKGEGFRLAFQIVNYIMSKVDFFCSVVISKDAQNFWKMYHTYEIGVMDCYYKLFEKQQYHVARISQKVMLSTNKLSYQVDLIKTKEECRSVVRESHLREQLPYKSIDYIVKRYFEFPYPQYHYEMWGIRKSKNAYSTFIIMREQKVEGAKVGRIVDIIGSVDELPEVAGFFEKLGKERDYEYIDCYCYGIPESIMRGTGFVKNEGDANIIPYKLDPVVEENEKIYFSTREIGKFRAFLADGDMDRPNLRRS